MTHQLVRVDVGLLNLSLYSFAKKLELWLECGLLLSLEEEGWSHPRRYRTSGLRAVVAADWISEITNIVT